MGDQFLLYTCTSYNCSELFVDFTEQKSIFWPWTTADTANRRYAKPSDVLILILLIIIIIIIIVIVVVVVVIIIIILLFVGVMLVLLVLGSDSLCEVLVCNLLKKPTASDNLLENISLHIIFLEILFWPPCCCPHRANRARRGWTWMPTQCSTMSSRYTSGFFFYIETEWMESKKFDIVQYGTKARCHLAQFTI